MDETEQILPNPTDLSFEEYREQDILDTGDGEFFDALDRIFGIDSDAPEPIGKDPGFGPSE